MEKKIILAKDMQLADVIRWPELGDWNTCIVKNVTDKDVALFRPYGHHADFSYTGGVICYIGVGDCTISRDSTHEYELLRRTELR